jgi:hypothetical protein
MKLRCPKCDLLSNSEVVLNLKTCPQCNTSVLPRDPAGDVRINWDDIRLLVELAGRYIYSQKTTSYLVDEFDTVLSSLQRVKPEGALELEPLPLEMKASYVPSTLRN